MSEPKNNPSVSDGELDVLKTLAEKQQVTNLRF